MRINLRRAVVLAGAALGLLATAAPSAQARTVGSITFQGLATLTGGGLSYPCAGNGTVNLTKCVTPVADANAPTGKTVIVTGGNTRGFGFSSGPCVGASVTDLPTVSAGAGTCTITASGTVTGACALSSGLGNYTETENKTAVTTNPPTTTVLTTTRNGTFHFVGVGGTLVITGDVNTAPGSEVVGVVEAVPIPTVSGTTLDNSCGTKSADEFTIAGEIAFVEP